MTLEEFAKQPIATIIQHPDFIRASIDSSVTNPLMWEVHMRASKDAIGIYNFLGFRVPHNLCVFYVLFDPVTFKK